MVDTYTEKINTLKEMIRSSSDIVFFGGAGVSTESNIPDFRSADGLYNAQTKFGARPEELISHSYFMAHTDNFYEYYKENLIYKDAKPNKAHYALAKLEKEGKLSAVLTQNIDGLHQLAGSKTVYELHGSVMRNYCTKCHKFFDVDYILDAKGTPHCDECGSLIKPDVVLYEEGLDDDVWSAAYSAVTRADMLIVGGTSLVVYPAAGLVNLYHGNKLVLINKSKTAYDDSADLVINDSIGKVLAEAVEDL